MSIAAKFTHTVWKRACGTVAMYRARGIDVFIKPHEKGYGVFSTTAQRDKYGIRYGHLQLLHTADWYCNVWIPAWRKAVKNGSEIVLLQRRFAEEVQGNKLVNAPSDYVEDEEELIAIETEDGIADTIENEVYVN